MSPDLDATLAEYLSLHAESSEALGTTRPELDPRIPDELREKVIRQRCKTQAASLGDDPELHRRHVEALNKGVRVVLRRLVPGAPKTPPPPMPVWDDADKRWVIPGMPPEPKPKRTRSRSKPKPKLEQVEQLPLPEPEVDIDDPDTCLFCDAPLTEAECKYPRLGLVCDRCLGKGNPDER